MPTVDPAKVPATRPGFGAYARVKSAALPCSTLPAVTTSGYSSRPSVWNAKSSPVRAKVCTSSIQTATPAARQRSISATKNSRGAVWNAALALDQLEHHRGDAAGMAREVRVERRERAPGRVRRTVVERHVQHVAAQRQSLAVRRPCR